MRVEQSGNSKTLSALGWLFGDQPRGLLFLCLTQMWERFSFYGMRSLLILYLTGWLLQPGHIEGVIGYPALRTALETLFGPLSIQAISSQIYGLYVALVYLMPLPGGIIADRLLGQRRAVLAGGILIAIGHFMMASDTLFLFALLFIVLGSGLFTPSVAALVGELYPSGDHRREKAFSTFYMAVQIGAFISPLVCGLVGEIFGWHYGFSLAGIGMALGLIAFTAGRKQILEGAYEPVAPLRATGATRATTVALGLLVLLSVLFWAAYEQVGNVLNLWLLNDTNRSIFGALEVKTSTFQAVNPLLLILLTPPIIAMWQWFGARGSEPVPYTKMIIGCFLLGGGYIILSLASGMGGGDRVSLWWTIGYLVALTLGELLFAPTSWALFSRMAPPHLASSMMGVWYLSLFGGGYLAGYLGMFWELLPRTHFWLLIGTVAAAGGCGILLIRPQLRHLTRILTRPAPAADPH